MDVGIVNIEIITMWFRDFEFSGLLFKIAV
jgi:hypothetical protein